MGAPVGNQNAAKAKRWSDAIDRALAKKSKASGIEELDRLAEKFLEEVEASGLNGYREFGDRIEGKPSQQLEHTGEGGGPVILKFDSVDAGA